MRALRAFLVRLAGSFGSQRREREMAEELESVVQMQTEDNLRSGMSPAEARRQALIKMGGVELVKQAVRDRRGIPLLETAIQDLRYAGRVLARSPGFCLVVVLSLAVGIGGNTGLFGVFNALMLRQLAVPEAAELSVVRVASPTHPSEQFSYPHFEQLRQVMPGDGQLAAMSRVARMKAGGEGEGPAEGASVQLVSGQYFSALGLAPGAGRLLGPDDNRTAGGHPVAVLSHAFWQRRFNRSPAAIGGKLALNGTSFTVVGVAPAGFSGVWLESPVAVWIPVAMQHEVKYLQNVHSENSDTDKPWLPQARVHWLDLVARTNSPPATAAALDATFQQWIGERAETINDGEARRLFRQQRLVLEPFDRGFSRLRQGFAGSLYALMALMAAVLVIACANTANLLLSRAAARQREIALRLSLGASRGRIVRQLFTESVVLGGLAGLAGLALAPFAAELLVRMATGAGSGPLPFSVGIDGRVLVFTVAVSFLATVLFGLVPAFRTTRVELAATLKSGGRGPQAGPRLNPARLLVASQVALSVVLVMVAGLFLRSLDNLSRQDLGLAREQLVSLSINPRLGGYQRDELPDLHRRLVERAEALPGVRSAAVAMSGVISGHNNSSGLIISGYQPGPDEKVDVEENRVGVHYFDTVGMRVIAGRDFDLRDHRDAPRVAIVNEAFARRYLASRPALGQHIGYGGPRVGYGKPEVEIVGLVSDARISTPREAPVPMAYFALAQGMVEAGTVEVRAAGDPRLLGEALRRAIAEMEPRLPIDRVSVLSDRVSGRLNPERAIARLTSLLGVLALGLACFGLYGVMSYAVTLRTAELGVRMALGAAPGAVSRMVLGESLRLVLLGLAVGLPLALAASRLISAQLFGVDPVDPVTLAGTTAALLGVAAASAWIPAARAARVDPLVALRYE
jgi:predicted permease